jgi:hypothetical protein
MASASTRPKLSREEFRKAKELEEARKAGTAAPALDDEGNMINPHIPQYISTAPWYLSHGAPSLKHQRMTKPRETTTIDRGWYRRGEEVVAGQAAKYRKGACANCGAMTHKEKAGGAPPPPPPPRRRHALLAADGPALLTSARDGCRRPLGLPGAAEEGGREIHAEGHLPRRGSAERPRARLGGQARPVEWLRPRAAPRSDREVALPRQCRNRPQPRA